MPPSTTDASALLVGAGDRFAVAAERVRAEIRRGIFGGASVRATTLAGRYRLLEPLGRGGQGEVWRAADPRLDRDVAIKLLHVGAELGERSQTWLRHEAKMLSRIAHPNVVAVFDLGTCRFPPSDRDDDHDAVFVVMELVVGEPMQKWVETHRPGADEILEMLRQVAEGLDAVHRAGLVHSDVKPSNILVANRVAKLADFGLAHAAWAMLDGIVERSEHDGSWDSTLTRPTSSRSFTRRVVAGTPVYMPPEQFAGSRIDERADVYALAVTMFEMLFGSRPHRGESAAALYSAKLRGAPRAPAGSSLPRSAYDELARSMNARAPDRHRTASALVRAVIDARRRIRRRRRRVALLGVALAGVAAWSLGDSDARVCRDGDIASHTAIVRPGLMPDAGAAIERAWAQLESHERALAEARTQACAAEPPSASALRCLGRLDARTQAVLSRLQRLESHELHRTPSLVARLGDPRACLRGDAEPGDVGPGLDLDDPALERAWARFEAARLDWAAGDVDRSLDALDGLAEDAALVPVHDEVLLLRADLLLDAGRIDEAERDVERVYRGAVAADEPRIAARAATDAALIAADARARFDEGMQWIRHARAQLDRAGAPADLAYAAAEAEGWIELQRGRPQQARVSFEQALALASSSDRSPADVAALRSKLALAMRLDGDEDEGLELLRAAHEELRQELGDLHPGVVNSLANLGHVLARANRFAEARPVLERALELRERIHGPTALSNTRLLGVLAQLDRAQGDVSAASARLRRIEDIEDRWLAPDDPERAENSLARAEVALDLGDDAAAERILAISRARFETTLPAGHPYHFGTLRVRARLARHRGHPAAATALLVEAVALAERHGLPNEEMATVLYIEAAEAAAASGDEGAARMWAIAAAASSPTASATLRDRIAALLAE